MSDKNKRKWETTGYNEDMLDEDGLPFDEYEEEFWDYEDKEYDSQEEDDDLENGAGGPSRRIFLRIIAFITVLSFTGLIMVTTVPVLRSQLADLVSESLRLEKDINIQHLQAAVVNIEVVAGKNLGVEQKSGTGFNIDPGGVVVTNHHVIENAYNIIIKFKDGTIYKAEQWSVKPEMDLAVITLNAANLPSVPLDISGLPRTGDKIRVVGNPLGMSNVVAEGRVQEYLRFKDSPERVFSIDAPIYPGNSGSPVFNSEGKVIGVVFASWQQEAGDEENTLGLAIPVEEVIGMQRGF